MVQELSNWARTQRFVAREVVSIEEPVLPDDPLPSDRVTELRRRALKLCATVQHYAGIGRHVRAQGSRWSFTPVVTCTDVVVETTGLSQRIELAKPGGEGLLAAALADEAKGPSRAYAFLEAGCVLDDAMNALRDEGLALATAGSSSGQLLAGVIGTGSHGADHDRAPIADWVRAILLVAPDGSLHWIEGDGEERLTRDDDALATLVPELDAVHRSSETLDAARVSLGSLGVVCALVLEVRPAYGLSEKVVQTSWAKARPELAAGRLFADSPLLPEHPEATGRKRRYLELLLNPYRISNDYGPDGDRDCSVLLVSRAEAAQYEPAKWKREKADIGLKAEVLVALAVDDRDFNRRVLDELIASGRQDSGGYRHAHDVMNYGRERAEKVWSTEVVVSTKDGAHLEFLDEVLSRFDHLLASGHLLAGFLSIRFTRGTRASLGMQTGDGREALYCHVELAPLQEPETVAPVKGGVIWDPDDPAEQSEEFLEALEQVAVDFRDRGLARLHWGQHGPTIARASATPAIYPGLEAWRDARRALAGTRRWTFASSYAVRTGLVEAPEGCAFAGLEALPAAPSEASADVRARAASEPVIVPATADVLPTTLFVGSGDGWVASSPFDADAPEHVRWHLIRHGHEEIEEDEAIAGRIAVAANADGRHEIFARSEDGRIFHRFLGHSDPAEGWYGWSRFDGTPRFVGDPAVALAEGGFLHCVAIDDQGRVQHRRQYRSLVSIGWKLWDELPVPPGTPTGTPAMLRDAEGHLVLFVRTDDGKVWMSRQKGAASDAGFAAFTATPIADAAGDPVAIRTDAGLLVCAPRAGGGLCGARRHVGSTELTPIPSTSGGPAPYPHTALGLCAMSPERIAVALTDSEGSVHLRVVRVDDGLEDGAATLPIGAISGAALASSDEGLVVLAKVAHDLVVWTRTRALSSGYAPPP